MNPELSDADSENESSETERLILKGERLFKRARGISDKYEEVVMQFKSPLKDEADAADERPPEDPPTDELEGA